MPRLVKVRLISKEFAARQGESSTTGNSIVSIFEQERQDTKPRQDLTSPNVNYSWLEQIFLSVRLLRPGSVQLKVYSGKDWRRAQWS